MTHSITVNLNRCMSKFVSHLIICWLFMRRKLQMFGSLNIVHVIVCAWCTCPSRRYRTTLNIRSYMHRMRLRTYMCRQCAYGVRSLGPNTQDNTIYNAAVITNRHDGPLDRDWTVRWRSSRPTT